MQRLRSVRTYNRRTDPGQEWTVRLNARRCRWMPLLGDITMWSGCLESVSLNSQSWPAFGVHLLQKRPADMIFIDESIQRDLGYICVGFAYCDQDPAEAVNDAISQAGLTPLLDEYKSGARMANAQGLHDLRDNIYRVVARNCKLGVYIGPTHERATLIKSAIAVADQIIQRNGLSQPQSVFVDEGILGVAEPSENIALTTNCDSKLIPGIQLADFVAYHCSYLLKCSLTGRQKKVLIKNEPHPLSGQEVDLDWLVRTDFRRNFFVEHRNADEIQGDDWFFKLAGYGAFFSEHLSPEVRAAAEETFDSMYFGCVW